MWCITTDQRRIVILTYPDLIHALGTWCESTGKPLIFQTAALPYLNYWNSTLWKIKPLSSGFKKRRTGGFWGDRQSVWVSDQTVSNAMKMNLKLKFALGWLASDIQTLLTVGDSVFISSLNYRGVGKPDFTLIIELSAEKKNGSALNGTCKILLAANTFRFQVAAENKFPRNVFISHNHMDHSGELPMLFAVESKRRYEACEPRLKVLCGPEVEHKLKVHRLDEMLTMYRPVSMAWLYISKDYSFGTHVNVTKLRNRQCKVILLTMLGA